MASPLRHDSGASSASMSDLGVQSHAAYGDAERRGAARFSRVLVEPVRAAALLAQSPVNTDALTPPAAAAATATATLASTAARPQSNRQRSTPQPVRRTLFSRLFRMKSSRGYDDDDAQSSGLSAAASPASHQSTPTHHHHHHRATYDAPATRDERLHVPGFARAVSMPAGKKTVPDEAASDGTAAVVQSGPPTARTLLEGPLVRLSSHKYWHAKATYFVLEEETTAVDSWSRLCLKQFRSKKCCEENREPLAEIVLSEVDVVVDITDRYIKHGLELFHRHAGIQASEKVHHHQRHQSDKPSEGEDGGAELHSLRLSVDDASAHRKWMRVLGTAIARLIDQSKRHYPITPADVEFAREKTKAFEPDAVTAIVATAVAVKSTAKVVPVVGSSDEEEDEDEDADHGENQLVQVHDADVAAAREDEMRGPEQPEVHSDCGEHGEENEGHRSSLSVVSDGFSDAWASPRHHDDNNGPHEGGEGYASDDNNHERSSNQFGDHDEQADMHQRAHAQRLSECYSPTDLVEVAHATTNVVQVSPSGTDSVASTPSPQGANGILQRTWSSTGDERDDAVLRDVAAAMAAASLAAAGQVVDTPPSSPPRSSHGESAKPVYGRQYPLTASSRLGVVHRPPMHSFNANGQVFTLDARYRLLKSIGNGAYGAVIAASDSVADMSVAVKKITNIFDDLVDAKRILREVRLLRHFRHKNITQLLDLAPPMTKKSFEDMYIITELMETDLHQVIYSMQPMSDDHVKYFLYQMLCALYHIHSAGVLHRDMKPSNILLNSNCDLKVCDFGLARGGMDADADARRMAQPGEMTEYVVTRWYRAPEIMLNCLQYTAAIDVWAVGCIFAEMLLREPLFPGNDYMHQLKLIIKFLGTPKQEDISFIKNVKALRFLTKLSISKPKKYREVFTGEDLNPLALDLLAQMLIFNPDKRISVEKALQHPYLATFYDPADITRAPPFAFGFDLPDDKLTKEALVDLLCEDVACFHPQLMRSMLQPPAPPLPMLPRPPMVATPNGGNRYFGTTASAS